MKTNYEPEIIDPTAKIRALLIQARPLTERILAIKAPRGSGSAELKAIYAEARAAGLARAVAGQLQRRCELIHELSNEVEEE